MSPYLRSVLFRIAGVIGGGAVWIGLIVMALANFDSVLGFPENLGITWPFWVVAIVVTVIVFFARRRLGPGPGWGSYALGVSAPFVGLMANSRVGDGGALLFWIPIALIVLVPLPSAGGLRSQERVS